MGIFLNKLHSNLRKTQEFEESLQHNEIILNLKIQNLLLINKINNRFNAEIH